jgi:predicted secreted protein
VTTYREEDDGAAVELAPGGRFEVCLEEAATSGYRWRAAEWDRAIVLEMGPEAAAPSSSAPGSKRKLAWALEALGPGEVIVEFQYGRQWETAPVRTYRLHVRVR